MTVSTGDKLTASLLNGLSGSGTRRAPMMYTFDRSTTPWTIWFDNGSGLQFPDYKTTATIYGYGYAPNINNTAWVTYPLVGNIISSSRGTLTIEKLKASIDAQYWADSTKVLNPVRDRNKYDWTEARYKPGQTWQDKRQANVIRVMYELGIYSDADVLSLGAKKKGG